MKLAYIEPIGGASGDMLLGALIDAGGDVSVVASAGQKVLRRVVDVEVGKVRRGALVANAVKIQLKLDEQERRLRDIEELIDKSSLKDVVKKRALTAFRHLAEAEARIHGERADEVFLHEVGGDDCIVDIVGFFALAEAMRIKWFYCGTVPFGRGFAISEHGAIPVPSPAAVELLRGFSICYVGEPHEMTTPTAAAIIKTVCQPHIPPQMVIEQVGYGAGARQKNITDIPNVLRVTIGRLYVEREPLLYQMEANLDDAEPRVVAHALEHALSEGASDAWMESIYGKKGRMGVKLCALVPEEACERVEKVFFEETTTLGVRRYPVQRSVLERQFLRVRSRLGEMTLKVGISGGRISNVSVEYETARALSEKLGIPLKSVIAEALFAAAEAGILIGAPQDVVENLIQRATNHI